jgi:hypothetical protein
MACENSHEVGSVIGFSPYDMSFEITCDATPYTATRMEYQDLSMFEVQTSNRSDRDTASRAPTLAKPQSIT